MSHRKILVGLIALMILLAFASPTWADLPPRPVPLPPTPEPIDRLVGGWIELQAQNVKGQWSVAQWQDSAGNWVNVESWRGAFDSVNEGGGVKKWWVDQASFSVTPFRWVVYEPRTNQIIAMSQPFNLPTQNRQTVSVSVTLAP